VLLAGCHIRHEFTSPDAGTDAGTIPDGGADSGPSRSGALRFNGVGGHVSVPSPGASEVAFTIEAWFRSTAMTGMIAEIAQVSGTVTIAADRSIYLRDGAVCFYVYEPTRSVLCSESSSFADGEWHHVAGTLGLAAGQRLYVDGALEASIAEITHSGFVEDQLLRIGFGHVGPDGAMIHFDGDIDEVRMWTVERTWAEVRDARAMRIDPGTATLTGYWPLDETADPLVAEDVSPFARDGTLREFATDPSPWIRPGAF
jgi:hypothetical protein